MKKLSVCFVLCSIIWSATCSAAKVDTIEVESSISAVNVFFQGARVTRDITLNLAPGRYYLFVQGLPLNTDPELIKVKTPKGVRLYSVSHKVAKPSTKFISRDLKALNKELQAFKDEIEWLRVQKLVYIDEEKFLKKNMELERVDGESHANGLRETAHFYRERLTELARLKIDITLSIRNIQNKVKEINTSINKLSSGIKIPQTQLLLSIDISAPASHKLQVEYFTNAAGWIPLYDFRFNEVSEPLELVYNASIFQSTGENWANVELILSEGLPKKRTTLPEFERSYLTQNPSGSTLPTYHFGSGTGSLKGKLYDKETKEPLPHAYVSVSKGSEQVAVIYTNSVGEFIIKPLPDGVYKVSIAYVGYKPEKVLNVKMKKDMLTFLEIEMEPQVQLEKYEVADYTVPLIEKDGGSSGATVHRSNISRMPGRSATNHWDSRAPKPLTLAKLFLEESPSISAPRISYTIEYKCSIPSNGEDRMLTIKTEKINVQFLYRAIPNKDTDVHLLARISDWGNLKLLSGKSTIYFQGAYTGESNLDAESTNDTLEIALGIDENILLERRLNKSLSSEQAVGNKIKKEVCWDITVRNNKSHPILIELIDQIPLSDHRSIGIEAIAMTDANYETDSGKLTWTLKLESYSSKKVNFSYELKYPESALVFN